MLGKLGTGLVGGIYSGLMTLGAFWEDGNLAPSEICYSIAAALAGTGLVAVVASRKTA